MEKQIEVINGSDALESFREDSKDFAKYQALAGQLQESAKLYSAPVKEVGTFPAAPRVLQRQSSLNDEQYQKAVEKAESAGENPVAKNPVSRRPGWANSPRHQSVQPVSAATPEAQKRASWTNSPRQQSIQPNNTQTAGDKDVNSDDKAGRSRAPSISK